MNEFDAIINGTGLVESMLAASLARVGLKVLVVDRNRSYGGLHRTLESRELHRMIVDGSHDPGIQINRTSGDLDILLATKGWQIDLMPKLMLANGEMCQLLVRSGVCRYLEFKQLPDSFIYSTSDDRWLRVPFTKEDVFMDQQMTLLKKRKLMKSIQTLMTADSEDATDSDDDMKVYDYMRSQKFDNDAIDIVAYSICDHQSHIDNWTITVAEARRQVRRYMNSVARFGNSPYLLTMYGTAEYAQAFSRVAAVFGAVQVLNYDGDSEDITVELDEGTQTKCVSIARFDNANMPITNVRHALFFMKQPIEFNFDIPRREHMPEHTFYFMIPPTIMNGSMVFGIHCGSDTFHAPDGHYILHVWSSEDDGDQGSILLSESIKSYLPSFETVLTVDFTSICDSTSIRLEDAVSEAKMNFDHIYRKLYIHRGKDLGWDEVPEFMAALPDPEVEQQLMMTQLLSEGKRE